MPTSPSAAPAPLLRAHPDAPTVRLEALGVTIRTRVATGESGGALALLEYAAPPGFRGPAPHWHAVLTETFVGLEGEAQVRVGDGTLRLGPGAVAVVPPRVVHAFANPGAAPARFLVLATPGEGLEGYFTALAAIVAAQPAWPPTDPAVLETLTAIAARHDTFAPPVAAR